MRDMQNMQKHYIGRKGQSLGPFSVEAIIAMVKAGEIELTDFIYIEESKDWLPLVKFSAVADVLTSVSAELSLVAPPAPEAKGSEDWFVLRGTSQKGPYSAADLVRALREQKIFEYDYVWNASLSGWKKIAELAEFQPTGLQKILGSQASQQQQDFFRRRHLRVAHRSSIIVHNSREVWMARGFEVSAGGAFLEIEGADLPLESDIYLHFKPDAEVPAFNALCRIRRKRNQQYGVEFLTIGEDAYKRLAEYTQKKSQVG